MADGLLAGRPAGGRRVAVLADGGGHGGVAARRAAPPGSTLPAPVGGARRSCASPPAAAAATNPVDLAGGGEQDVCSFARVARALLASGEVDAVLLTGWFGGYAEYGERFARREAAVACAALGRVPATGRPRRGPDDAPGSGDRRHPARCGRAGLRASSRAVARSARAGCRGRPAARRRRRCRRRRRLPPVDGYAEPGRLLAAAGVAFVAARSVAADGDVAEAASELGYPVVVKALGTLHKSDAGGVIVGIARRGAAAAAVADMQRPALTRPASRSSAWRRSTTASS